jgi:hypothetical protein
MAVLADVIERGGFAEAGDVPVGAQFIAPGFIVACVGRNELRPGGFGVGGALGPAPQSARG